MEKEIVKAIVEQHKNWLSCNGGEKANLAGADLSWADLAGANLMKADLAGANLMKANLAGADLSWADLAGANLSWADLNRADLVEANLTGADLLGANLAGVNLAGVNLSGAKNVPYIPMICPEQDAFFGWKKSKEGRIVKLLVPADAERSSSTGRKCRCNKAQVVSITSIDEKEYYTEAHSFNDESFVYRVGEWVKPDTFDRNRWEECAGGIHFFMQWKEAVDYDFT